jgi:uncharacterized protein
MTAQPNPLSGLAAVPRAAPLWARAVTVASILVTVITIERIFRMLANYWLLDSLDLASVFWTNFRMGALLYVVGLVVYAAAVLVPAFLHPSGAGGRAVLIKPGILLATVAALLLALRYEDFLFGGQEVGFGEVDPVFGRDFGFYVFDLPYLWVIWRFALGAALVYLVASAVAAAGSRSGEHGAIRRMASAPTRAGLLLLGLVAAWGVWLSRFDLLYKDNMASSVWVGAELVDVTGLFSHLNLIRLATLGVLALGAAAFLGAGGTRRPAQRILVAVVVGLIAFRLAVDLRDRFLVRPNEPVVQLPYIQRHVDATRKAYGIAEIEEVSYVPKRPGDPVPSAEELLAATSVRNAPLWPGFVSHLERLLDPQHAHRILLSRGDPVIYGPTLDHMRQNQKLRAYYNFINVDSVRYTIDGEKRMLVSAAREVPLYEPVPWLNYWGQRYMLFTHGHGLVMAAANEIGQGGGLEYLSWDIPAKTSVPELQIDNERIYYGEGATTMAFSNVRDVDELDYPSDEGREEMRMGPEGGGVPLDSLLRRAVLGAMGGRVIDFVFSNLITDETRVHYYRQPLERLRQVAPFLYYDSNPYAVTAEGRIVWMTNALSTSDRYPYSNFEQLGDKSDERSPFPQAKIWINYVEDSVKATVDADTGRVRLFQIADDPVIRTWASIYPELFTPVAEMPESLRAHITYPVHLFHMLFDDLYIYYHMADPMYFFNLEDMWDDGDEVLGPMVSGGKAITFSFEPSPILVDTGGRLPESEHAVQYALYLPFTSEKALNLRAIPYVYQDWPDYGKSVVLTIPKGTYVMGPEQADAIIDQTPEISQSFSWWNRLGMDVLRGHTSLLPVGDEILYVEPIFLRSQQNPVTQLKKVAVVFRNQAAMGDTLEEAVRAVVVLAAASEQQTPTAVELATDTPAAQPSTGL